MESNINVNEVTQTQQSSFPKVQDFESTTILSDKKKEKFLTNVDSDIPTCFGNLLFLCFWL